MMNSWRMASRSSLVNRLRSPPIHPPLAKRSGLAVKDTPVRSAGSPFRISPCVGLVTGAATGVGEVLPRHREEPPSVAASVEAEPEAPQHAGWGVLFVSSIEGVLE